PGAARPRLALAVEVVSGTAAGVRRALLADAVAQPVPVRVLLRLHVASPLEPRGALPGRDDPRPATALALPAGVDRRQHSRALPGADRRRRGRGARRPRPPAGGILPRTALRRGGPARLGGAAVRHPVPARGHVRRLAAGVLHLPAAAVLRRPRAGGGGTGGLLEVLAG